MVRTFFVPLLLALLLWDAPVSPPATAAEPAAPDLAGLLAGEGALKLAGRTLERAELRRIYQERDFAPLWVDAPEREAALLQALGHVGEHGLDPLDFAVPPAAPAERDLLLTDAFLRCAAALARGRADAGFIENDWAFPPAPFDPGAALKAAVAGPVGAVLDRLAPAAPGYAALEAALARYRRIEAAGGWRPLPDTGKLKRGDSGPAVAALRRRLAAEGYLPESAAGDGFGREVEQAVRRFQTLHGIAADGEVGAATLRALNLPVEARIEQIRVNLERWRELPRNWAPTRIDVNAASATLTAIAQGETRLEMRAIVGAEDHPTPVLHSRIDAVLFNPPWNVPASIVKNEILPRLKRDPRYLERNNLVRIKGLALQQPPGPRNPLGRVKFDMPNVYDVYLHDTPGKPLFARVSRMLSHGCVRLEEPRRLALYLLSAQAGWAEADIDQAIAAGTTRRVAITHAMPVYLLYWTAYVDGDGAVEFRDDIYGRDLRLSLALAQRDAAERITPAPGPAITVSERSG